MKNKQFRLQSEEGSFEYELAYLLNKELDHLQQYVATEKENLRFHSKASLHQWSSSLDGLSLFQKSLLQYYLPFKTEISSDLALLKNCLQAMLRQKIDIDKRPARLQEFEQVSLTQLDQHFLDFDQHIGGQSPSSKPLVKLTIHLTSAADLAAFSRKGEDRIFLEKALIPIFIEPHYDCSFDFEWEGEKKEQSPLKKELDSNYLDMGQALE